jgi:alkylation response protein AidB-like acyl-CoA dehydrogenase
MDFDLDQTQEMIVSGIRQFVKKECPPGSFRQYDERGECPIDLYRKLGRAGWLGLPIPKKYGGMGGSFVEVVLTIEQLATAMPALASLYFNSCVFGSRSLLIYGSEEQRQKYLPQIASGQMFVGLALTESDSGSDAASMRTRAVEQDGGFRITGTKMFISAAELADLLIVVARTSAQGKKEQGLTVFGLEKKTAGFETRRLKTLGRRSIPLNEVIIDAHVGHDSVIGEVNQGWMHLGKTLEGDRACVGAQYVGSSQSVIAMLIRYLKEREQFGKTLSSFQVLRHRIADMQALVDSARLMVYRAAWMVNQRRPCRKEASMAKLAASEAYVKLASEGVHLMGAFGYTKESEMEIHFRDSRAATIGGGTSEIHREIIARELFA